MPRPKNSPTLDLFIEAMRIPARLYRDYPEHWIRFCGEQALPSSPRLDSLQNFGDGFRAPHEDLFYGCTRPRILPARPFIIPPYPHAIQGTKPTKARVSKIVESSPLIQL
jgi:hypothetical protein